MLLANIEMLSLFSFVFLLIIIVIIIIIELHPLVVVLFSVWDCNRLSTHSCTPTASRFQNNISLRHADADGDEVPHYTPPISPFPPHSSPTTLSSGPRGRDALMHMHTRPDKFTVSVGEFFFFFFFFFPSFGYPTVNSQTQGEEGVKLVECVFVLFLFLLFWSVGYNSAALSCVVFSICRESRATMTTISGV